MTLTEIWVYPVKSMRGTRVKRSKVLPKGLAYDRRYMLVDENNRFITQRVYPQLALFRPSFGDNVFSVAHKGDVVDIPIVPESSTGQITVTIWDDVVQGVEMGERYNQWFTERAGLTCKLVYFPEGNERRVDPDFAVNREQVGLADGFPFLIIGQSSLDELNSKLSAPLPMNRFRPNFVFDGGKPFEEDTWKNFRIGANGFTAVKPCARCAIPTIDQDTAVKGTEPLATLATFRKVGGKVNFGQNLVARNHLEVAEGDVVEVESFQ
ncbi:MAG TPA: MOSC domain-containing protein [Cyclobacteriaceae bacterium]|nr:MOSC domain-containing protein [Cyclobacteriaceae bacterium]